MKKIYHIVRFLFLAACICTPAGHLLALSEASANQGAQELQRKMADIALLKQQLEDRRQQANSVLNALRAQQRDLETEIRILIKSMNIKNYKQADQHLRVHYNLALLRRIAAYIKEFNSRIDFYLTGRDKLAYLHQLASDDVQMITALRDYQIDALTTQISLVINKYLPNAHIIQIDPEDIELESPQSVWDEIISKKR